MIDTDHRPKLSQFGNRSVGYAKVASISNRVLALREKLVDLREVSSKCFRFTENRDVVLNKDVDLSAYTNLG